MADEGVLPVVQGIPVGGGDGLQGVEEAGGRHEGRIGQAGRLRGLVGVWLRLWLEEIQNLMALRTGAPCLSDRAAKVMAQPLD